LLFTILSFLVLLSVVVMVHEWGHFITGRRLGVGIERFAFGFGPAIVKKVWRGVEYRINWVLFGGYVKFVGDEPDQPVPEELRAVAFNTAPAHKRALIAFAGPAMNVVLAFALFCVIFLVGFPTPTTKIGEVEPGSPAAQAGLIPGDHITAIDGRPLRFWRELSDFISENPNRTYTVAVQRDGQTLQLPITTERIVAMNMFGFDAPRGSIGISPRGQRPWIGVTGPDTPAYAAGIRTGDLLLSVNGRAVEFLADVDARLAAAGSASLNMTLARGEDNVLKEKPEVSETVALPAPPAGQTWSMAALGLESGELYVYSVSAGGRAEKAGLQKGDRLVSVAGKTLTAWDDFATAIRGNPGQAIEIQVRRDGQALTLTATPELAQSRDLLGKEESFGRIGVSPFTSYTPAEEVAERYYNPVKILVRGFQESWFWTVMTARQFYYLVVGKTPTSTLGGPILIAQLAGESARQGWINFIFFLAVISVNLAILNLLPIPILDGGHLLLLTIESLLRRPMSERAVGIAQRVGLTFIGALILLVFYNDLSRVWFQLKEHLLR